jgi:NAD(P)-dependent dehydrogenase (short-subunit alcohol dehydrogenase family)
MDLGQFGITVNCIAPGPFLTELTLTNFTEETRQKFADRTALGRFGNLDELAGPVLLLASEAGSDITGACPVVDGGTIVKRCGIAALAVFLASDAGKSISGAMLPIDNDT